MTDFKVGDYVEIVCDYYKGRIGRITHVLENSVYQLRIIFRNANKYDGGAFEMKEVIPSTKEKFEQSQIEEQI